MTTLTSLCSAALVAACGSYPSTAYQSVGSAPANVNPGVQYGHVRCVDLVQVAVVRSSGAGTVAGAVVGAVIGHQVGGGRGEDVATGMGKIGGAVIGHQIESRNRQENVIHVIGVRLEAGEVRHFEYREFFALRIGDRLKLKGGQLYRP